MWPGLESASFFGLRPLPVSSMTTYVVPSSRGSSSQVWYACHWSVSPYQPMRAAGSNSWTVLWMCAPKVIQSNVTPAPRSPLEALTVTSRALEYQSGQAVAWRRCSQIFPGGAAITMSLWANRSACSGTMPCGQWMCAERRWMSSMIDMIVPPFAASPGLRAVLAAVLVQQPDHLLPRSVQVGAQPYQGLRGHAVARTDEAEQDVLGADVAVAELDGFIQRQLQHFLRLRGERNVSGRSLLAPA